MNAPAHDATGEPRRLVVLRHAKSDRPAGVPDHERPLAPRGRRDAPEAGRALAAAEWDTPPPVRHDARLYGADAEDLLAVVREAPAEVTTLLLIGHNPGLEDLVLDLAGEGLDDALDDVRTKFPTSAIAVLAWHGSTWRSLAPGTALLTDMIVPRGEKG